MPSFKDSTSIVFLHPPSPFCFLSAIGHSWVGSLSCGWHSSLLTGLATSILSPKSHSLHRHQSGIPETPFHFNHLSLSPVSRWAHQTACFFLSTPGVQGDLKAQGQCHLHESSPCLPTLWDLSELAIFFFFSCIFITTFLHSALNLRQFCASLPPQLNYSYNKYSLSTYHTCGPTLNSGDIAG